MLLPSSSGGVQPNCPARTRCWSTCIEAVCIAADMAPAGTFFSSTVLELCENHFADRDARPNWACVTSR